MIRILAISAASIAAIAASSASAQTIINLPAFTLNGTTPAPTSVTLAAGTYTATVIGTANGGIYNGWNAATSNGQFYPTGVPAPAPGFYTEEFGITNNGVTTTYNTPKYNSYAEAMAAATPITFTVSSLATTLSFFIPDLAGQYSDNSGGVSLRIVGSAVPEPTTWAMMIAGFGLVGFAMRRRNANVARVSYAA